MTFERLENIVDIKKGKKPTFTETPDENSIRVLQIDDLRNDITLKFTNDKSGVLANEEDVLLVWDGANAGTIGFGKKGYIGSTIALLRKKGNRTFSTVFIGKFLQSKFYFLRSKTTGATIPHIDGKILRNLEIPILSIEAQLHIADFLSKAENLIAQRKESIRLLDDFLGSTFLEMFGDPYVNQKGWKYVSLESLCSKIIDCPHETPKYENEATDFYCVRSSDIQEGNINLSETKFVSQETYLERIKRYEPQLGEVIYTREGGRLGNAARIPKGKNICLGQRMMLFVAKSEISTNEFIWAFLNSKFTKKLISNISGGGAAPRVNVGQLKKLQIYKPPLILQTQFAKFVEKTETLKAQYQQSLQELENLYGSFSQRAFKGEITLK